MPTTDNYGQGISIASPTDPPDIPAHIQALAAGVIPKLVLPYASAAARTANVGTPAEGMTTWLTDVNRLETYNGTAWVVPPPVVTTTSSGATAGAGFSVVSFSGTRVTGLVVMIGITFTRTSTQIDSGSAGNIADTVMGTIPAGWRPAESLIVLADDGFGCGGCLIGTDGVVTLRSWSSDGAIVAGRNIKMNATFIQP